MVLQPGKKRGRQGDADRYFLPGEPGCWEHPLMPRQPRAAPGGYAYHALNRAVARLPLFEKDGDFEA
jgi:hypothetical protein